MAVEWIGLEKIRRKLSPELLSDALRMFYEAVTASVADEMASTAPRRTGKLASSFKPSVNTKDPPRWGKVSNRVRYARFQAYGTTRNPPGAFWDRGIRTREEAAARKVSKLGRDIETRWGR